MNLRHLQIFKIVCEEENITKAAEKLFISQPAVSKAIHELEADLNVSLFDRISQKIYLNETGRQFLVKVSELLKLYDHLKQDIEKLETQAMIKLGSSITIANFILPKVITDFKKSYPKTSTKVMIANARKIEEMVYNNEVDLGVVEGLVYNEELVKIPFSSYQLTVICSPAHPFAFKEAIDIRVLLKEQLLLREQGSAIRDVFDSALSLQDIKVTPEWTSINSQALIQAVKQNLGISVLPRILVREELIKGALADIKVNNLELWNTNHIIFHKNKFQTTSFKKLMTLFTNFQ